MTKSTKTPEKATKPRKKHVLLDDTYYISLILKGLSGIFEAIGAVVILIFNPPRLHYFLELVAQTEFAHRHHAFVNGITTHISNGYTVQLRYFLFVYLLVHAAVKLVSVVGLFMNKRWAYPFALITLGLMMLYQLYEIIFVKPTVIMVGLTIFDIAVLAMIWREYQLRILKPAKEKAQAAAADK